MLYEEEQHHQDIPSYPSDEEDAVAGGLAQRNKDLDAVGPSDGQ